jgi:hypothetical protein
MDWKVASSRTWAGVEIGDDLLEFLTSGADKKSCRTAAIVSFNGEAPCNAP